MPSLQENLDTWSNPSVWLDHDLGEAWSKEFGGTDILWYSYIYPRIYSMLNGADLLEIAPGRGRITKYLLQTSKSYVGYDLSPYCIEYLQSTYDEEFFLNNGKSFPNTADDSVDFIFSWDSLVHADEPILFDYAKESLRVLRDDGVAFIHHSNNDSINYAGNPHWRGHLQADSLKKHIEELGGHVILQEFITWDDDLREYSDCITLFSKHGNGKFVGLNNNLFSVIRSENKRMLEKYNKMEMF